MKKVIITAVLLVFAVAAWVFPPSVIFPTVYSPCPPPRPVILFYALKYAEEAYFKENNEYASNPIFLANAGLISPDRAEALDGGNEANYAFIYSPTVNGYDAYANPMWREEWIYSYFINESGILRRIENIDGTQHTSGGESWSVLGLE